MKYLKFLLWLAMVILITLALLLARSAHADDWTTGEVVAEVTATSLLVIDYRQTVAIQEQMYSTQNCVTTYKPQFSLRSGNYLTDTSACTETEHHQNFEENRLLGKHPSKRSIAEYFGTLIVTQIVVADLLPQKYRDMFLGGLIIVEAVTIDHNYNLGITIKI